MSRPKIAIVGGGWAGLAAATELSDYGFKCTIYEKSGELGGRCSSFWSEDFNEWLDSGPHIFIKAYRQSLSLLEKWDVSTGLNFDDTDRIPWILKGGKTSILKLSSKRTAAAAAFMTFSGMSAGDKLKSVRLLDSFLRVKEIDLTPEPTVREFLDRYGIKRGSCGGFWDSLTIAVMNAPPEVCGLLPLWRAFQEGLLIGGESGRIGLPTTPFKQLYMDSAETYLVGKSVFFQKSKTVSKLRVDKSGNFQTLFVDLEECKYDAVILALPPAEVLRLLPKSLTKNEYFRRFETFEYSPIAGIHFEFERPVLRQQFAFLPGAFTHWIFGKGPKLPEGWSKISAVISHAPRKAVMSTQEIADLALSELKDRLILPKRTPVKAVKVIRTVRATVVLKPESDSLRPDPVTPVKGLFLAGDWCATGLPATIESAAISGINAAQAVIRQYEENL
ncbi:hydroxysqualene dehydroxylase HpnE [Calditrichota bacterium]